MAQPNAERLFLEFLSHEHADASTALPNIASFTIAPTFHITTGSCLT